MMIVQDILNDRLRECETLERREKSEGERAAWRERADEVAIIIAKIGRLVPVDHQLDQRFMELRDWALTAKHELQRLLAVVGEQDHEIISGVLASAPDLTDGEKP